MYPTFVRFFGSELYFAGLVNFFSNFSFLILFLGMLIYWIQASNYQTKNGGGFSATESKTLIASNTLPLGGRNLPKQGTGPISDFNIFDYLVRDNPIFQDLSNERNFGKILMAIANISLFLLLVLRWFESGHFPLSNLYESLMFLSWSLTMIHLVLEFVFSSKEFEKRSFAAKRYPEMKLIGSIIAPCALFTNAFATFSLPKEMQEASPLVPALQSNWLMMHVTVMILSYAALIFGSLLSIGFLVLTEFPFSKKNDGVPKGGASPDSELNPSYSKIQASLLSSDLTFLEDGKTKASKMVSSFEKPDTEYPKAVPSLFPTFTLGRGAGVLDSQGKNPLRPSPLAKQVGIGFARKNGFAGVMKKSPYYYKGRTESYTESPREKRKSEYKSNLACILDNLSYRVLGLGFPLLTIGILSGAVWANEAWGSYWSWDPKETWALLTWLVFAIYLHTRLTKGWQGKKPALIASFGFITVWICFLGVNLIGEGLHSYGWIST